MWSNIMRETASLSATDFFTCS